MEVTVTNVGDRHGSDVVQVYGSQNSPRLVRANTELLAFDRVSLDAGEEATVELSIPASDLGYYRPGDGHVVEADRYDLAVRDHTASVRIDGTYL